MPRLIDLYNRTPAIETVRSLRGCSALGTVKWVIVARRDCRIGDRPLPWRIGARVLLRRKHETG